MDIYKNFDIVIDEKEILRVIGYGDSLPGEEILESVREEISRSYDYIKPVLITNKLNIIDKNRDRVALENNVVLEGEYISNKLKDCECVVVTAATAGESIDGIIKSSFESGDYLRGMIVDAIGSAAVEYINKIYWGRLAREAELQQFGMTSRLSPGTGGWDIDAQRKIFSCVDGTLAGISLTDSFLMVPMKSTSTMYGLGKGIGIARPEHICSECNMKNCAYRMDNKVEVRISGKVSKALYAERGTNLLDLLQNQGLMRENPCGGKGTCGKCRVKVKMGRASLSEGDRKHLSEEETAGGVRLACGIKLSNPIEIEIMESDGLMNVFTGGEDIKIDVQPKVSKHYIELDCPSIKDQRSDCSRIREGLSLDSLKMNNRFMSDLPHMLRQCDFKGTVVLYDDILLSFERGDTSDALYGAALDIGTTTLACYLMDLRTGKVVDVESAVNSQRIYGADVISRINYTMENEKGLKVLRDLIVNQINEMLISLCRRQDIEMKNIYNMTVAGNPTMIHLLQNLPVRNISQSPYIPVNVDRVEIEGNELGLPIGGYVNILPGVSGYIGSDITAGMLACGIDKSKGVSLFMDLGTNGEIVLGSREWTLSCSTAAGPAFEGASIRCGVGGIKGAISKIDLSRDIIYETIGGIKPCGICGSGVLDMVHELLKYNIIDETGKMVDIDCAGCNDSIKKRLGIKDGMKYFAIEDDIIFTQKDVREVQLAVAAVKAGIRILMKEKDISYSDIENVCIAGGFGNYMDVQSALGIGLIPMELSNRIKSVGNSAGSGARMCLLSRDCLTQIDELAAKTRYIELSGRQDFQDYFVDFMMLGGSIL